jgi:hypothetical protein
MLSSHGFVTKMTKLATPNINNFLKTVIMYSHDFCSLKIQKTLKKQQQYMFKKINKPMEREMHK